MAEAKQLNLPHVFDRPNCGQAFENAASSSSSLFAMSTSKQRIISPHVAEYPPGYWSNCIRAGNTLWLSGFTARADDRTTILGVGDAYEQSRVIFEKVRNCVEAAGAGMADVVNMTIYVTDMADNKQVWKARQEFFEGDFPASTLVQVVALGTPEILVEIACQAIAPPQAD
ncbi:RidA family protein [Variovorax sp. J2P1-31]|uniref:RidA family protein n=2 Tax=Variovorax TaxID=34072 RepID=UPI0025772CE6|nr:RidA family protein [Variovorax sp. J2P1-31]MDM0149425.1 RidA family protein [Variovorax sp. J2P1-31]